MYARLLAILAVVVVMGACTAAEGSPTTTTTTGSPTTTQPAAEVEDGDQFALVNDVTAGVVTLDPAMLLTGDAAVEAARADGVIGPDEDLPNDFYISNPVKESLQVPIRMDATCRLYGFDSEGALMDVEVVTPEDYMGDVMGDLNRRRGMIDGMEEAPGGLKQINAEVPLSEMFGYSTTLRSLTQGKAEFTMEFATFRQVPKSVSDELIKKYQDEGGMDKLADEYLGEIKKVFDDLDLPFFFDID